MDTVNNSYPGFNILACELSAFARCMNLFTILLKNDKLVHFKPTDADGFYIWLKQNKIRDVWVEEKSGLKPN